ncbi:hypothetical protein [Pedobacter psychrodurus]|uniref:hypothetical protein n=1 Tax=Pedobacter psychrodurus TaxID=2530456 RepID=UPI00292FFD6E|nr:hypothetical protein [Pedobacter psychrodurus]
MKVNLLAILFLMLSILANAQDKGGLTKAETVNYINKKLAETVGHYKTNLNRDGTKGDKNYYWAHSISLSGDKIQVSRNRSNYIREKIRNMETVSHQGRNYSLYPCNYYEDLLVQDFNPMHIISVELLKDPVSGEPIGSLKLNLKANTAQSRTVYTSPNYQFPDGTNAIKYEYWGKCYGSKEGEPLLASVNFIYINFLAADPDNFVKLKKAFEYLRDLYKAEDDPFAN